MGWERDLSTETGTEKTDIWRNQKFNVGVLVL